MSSTDKTSTTGTITEVKELVEEVIPEKEQQADNIGEDEASKGIHGSEKSEQITLNDKIEPEVTKETEGINVETEDPEDNKTN